MAIHHQADHHRHQHRHEQPHRSFSIDSLYCEEHEDEWGPAVAGLDDWSVNGGDGGRPFASLMPLEQDLFWDDDELLALFYKEKDTSCLRVGDNRYDVVLETDRSLSLARTRAVDWILEVNFHYGFSPLTAVLAVNYLDRFLSGLHFRNDKPWMIQLVSVACLSLAAKVEETHVPLLLDFQVEESKYVFEAKMIQRMELLVLSALQWRMNPVTPLSFLDHIMRRLGLRSHLHWEFLRRCESLLLSVIADSRFIRYLPSVLATATMLHVIYQVDPCNATDYQNQLLSVLKISKEQVDDCYQLMKPDAGQNKMATKRRYDDDDGAPGSPSGVIDASFSSDDSSNDSWAVVGSSVSSSRESPQAKKSRTEEQEKLPMPIPQLVGRVFVNVVSSPR